METLKKQSNNRLSGSLIIFIVLVVIISFLYFIARQTILVSASERTHKEAKQILASHPTYNCPGFNIIVEWLIKLHSKNGTDPNSALSLEDWNKAKLDNQLYWACATAHYDEYLAYEDELNLKSQQQITPTPLPTINQISITKPSNNIDCTGPDGKHFQTSQKECNAFNAAWGKAKNNNTNTSSPKFTIPKYTSTTIKTIPCLLSVGVYQLTESDCAYLKTIDSIQQRQPLPNYYVSPPDFNTINNQPAPVDNNILRNQCLQAAEAKWTPIKNAYNAAGTAGGSDYQNAANQYEQEVATCNYLYQ